MLHSSDSVKSVAMQITLVHSLDTTPHWLNFTYEVIQLYSKDTCRYVVCKNNNDFGRNSITVILQICKYLVLYSVQK